jgi:septal ring factor EnvC (AmiA/AmiB activator)
MSNEGSATSAGAREDGTASDAPRPSDDPQVLREEIERTREQLGETIEALAAKADVKAQAQQKLSQLTARLKTAAGQAKQRAAATSASISKATPEPVQRAASTAAVTARRHRGPLAAAAGAAGAAVLALLLILRRRRR